MSTQYVSPEFELKANEIINGALERLALAMENLNNVKPRYPEVNKTLPTELITETLQPEQQEVLPTEKVVPMLLMEDAIADARNALNDVFGEGIDVKEAA